MVANSKKNIIFAAGTLNTYNYVSSQYKRFQNKPDQIP